MAIQCFLEAPSGVLKDGSRYVCELSTVLLWRRRDAAGAIPYTSMGTQTQLSSSTYATCLHLLLCSKKGVFINDAGCCLIMI